MSLQIRPCRTVRAHKITTFFLNNQTNKHLWLRFTPKPRYPLWGRNAVGTTLSKPHSATNSAIAPLSSTSLEAAVCYPISRTASVPTHVSSTMISTATPGVSRLSPSPTPSLPNCALSSAATRATNASSNPTAPAYWTR